MDIRARLLFAFAPLVVVVLFLAFAVPLAFAQASQRAALQEEAIEDLLRGQDLALLIFLEHDTAGHIAEGEVAPDSVRYRDARAQAGALVAAEAERDDASVDLERQIAEAYAQLGRLHDEVIAAAAAGDLERASELFERVEVDEQIDTILSLAQEARDVNNRALETISAEADAANQRSATLLGAALVVGVVLALGLTWLLVLQVARPLDALAVDAARYASGERSGQLSPAGDIAQIRRLRDSFQHLIDANTDRQGKLQSALDELQRRIGREERLRETVQALSVPAVPLADDTLLLPLVGHLDQRRSQELTRGLLEAVAERRARSAVIDITGLVELNAEGALALRQAAEAARLLGCRVTIVGVRADQAQILAESDLAASGVAIARDIPSVLGGNGRP